MISCGHCGDAHHTVDEVRGCSGTAAPSAQDEAPPPPGPSGFESIALAPQWEHLAGPGELGRSLVINPDQPVPAPWVGCARVAVDGSPGCLEKLQAARSNRERLVIELHIELPSPHAVLEVDFWQLDPHTELAGERLRHLVLDHSVDGRSSSSPTIRAVSLAVAAGATIRTDGPGDVTTPTGSAWCDGGPLTWFDPAQLGAPVIPAANLGRGSLRSLESNPPSAELATDQLAAVVHGGGGARIIAPAGSGKTRVLTERARHLIRDRGIDSRGICLLAFNVRAREEMQERTSDLDGLEIRTLNSLALAIQTGRGPFRVPADRPAPRVIDEREVRRALDDLVKSRRQAMSDPMAAWIEALTASRLGLRSPAAVEKEFGGDVRDFANVLPLYREKLRRAGVVDFDEQILGAIEVLCTDPAARAQARRACQVVLVDEFQDLTPAHVLLIRLLAGPQAEVFAVGDDDQTIYGYAGASPAWLIDFTDLFPGAGTHDLEVNYRCPPEIVQAASTLLTHNQRRLPKAITADPGREGGGSSPSLRVEAVEDPTALTLSHVSVLLEQGTPPADIAVLTRVNATLLGPMLALSEAGIRTNAPIDSSFLQRTGVAGALAWLRLATTPERRLDGTDIDLAARRPPRGMSRTLVGWMAEQSSPRDLMALAGRLRQERDQNKVADFVADLTTIRQLAADGADTVTLLTSVRDQLGLGTALDTKLDTSRRSVDRSAHGDDLAAILTSARHERDPSAFPGWLTHRVDTAVPDRSGVRLSTVHRVKGREWRHVIVHEADVGLFPHRLAADKEEERRVFHVAITRGSESVLVVAGSSPSPFTEELFEPARPSSGAVPAAVESSPDPGPELADPHTPADSQLREELKAWRLERSRTEGIPAYRIFSDKTLDELVSLRPTNASALLQVSGIGPAKADTYGEEILSVIAGSS